MLSVGDQWRAVIAGMRLRHLDREAIPILAVVGNDLPALHMRVANAMDTVTDVRMMSLAISSVELTYFPGERVAQAWIAAAWAGYMQHEALELVTLANGTRPLDPHGGDASLDRGLRCGLPVKLTPKTLLEALCAVMPEHVAFAIVAEAA